MEGSVLLVTWSGRPTGRIVNHKDHLGNIRLAFTDHNEDGKVELLDSASEITQQNDFYPFGMAHKGEGPFHGDAESNRYRYNGIERNEELGLDLAFYRSDDPAVGRWMQIDPQASKYPSMNPYNASGHKGGTKKGLNIVDDSGNRNAPGEKPDGTSVTMKYVNVHTGASDKGNYNSRGSAGCITICPTDVSTFFNHFDFSGTGGKTGNASGTIRVSRGSKTTDANALKATAKAKRAEVQILKDIVEY